MNEAVRAMQPSSFDLYLFHEGTLYFAYKTFGAHFYEHEGQNGVRFVVWAPQAKQVSVVGDFNAWNAETTPLTRLPSGVWYGWVPALEEGTRYKYAVLTATDQLLYKADPFAFSAEVKPQTASRVIDLRRLQSYPWRDGRWLKKRAMEAVPWEQPLAIYEVHLASWRKHEDGRYMSYRELADELIPYVKALGFTHIELMPVMEHPYDRSWGYQITGYYAPTSRFGDPLDLMVLIDRAHQAGIGVILDWVPGHFVRDAHGLAHWDGSALYEFGEPWRAEHPGWGTLAFDLGRPEVHSFLISNALYYFDLFHIDGLRIDAVSAILYRDYGRETGKWVPNLYGGREDLEGIEFLKKLNHTVFQYFPHALMIAEESSSFPLVTYPPEVGGLGFNFKWNMGWMNDMLRYLNVAPEDRPHHHQRITFSLHYAFSENYILPLSHDEVVYGKRSLLEKIPGPDEEKFATLRAFFLYMYTHPGKKLLFMGSELAQRDEWYDEGSLHHHLLNEDHHARFYRFVQDLNKFYKKFPALWKDERSFNGFSWIDADNYAQSIIVFVRMATKEKSLDNKKSHEHTRDADYALEQDVIIVVVNFSRERYKDFRIGVPYEGIYEEVMNTDKRIYGGGNRQNRGQLYTEHIAWHGRSDSLVLTVPPLTALALVWKGDA